MFVSDSRKEKAGLVVDTMKNGPVAWQEPRGVNPFKKLVTIHKVEMDRLIRSLVVSLFIDIAASAWSFSTYSTEVGRVASMLHPRGGQGGYVGDAAKLAKPTWYSGRNYIRMKTNKADRAGMVVAAMRGEAVACSLCNTNKFDIHLADRMTASGVGADYQPEYRLLKWKVCSNCVVVVKRFYNLTNTSEAVYLIRYYHGDGTTSHAWGRTSLGELRKICQGRTICQPRPA
jgi:hypothetical protein